MQKDNQPLRAKLFPLMTAGLCSAALLSGGAQAQSFEREIELLKQRIKQLEEAQKKQPKIKVNGAGIRVVDSNSKTSFRVNGRIHIDADAFDGAYNDNNGGATATDIFARRARVGVLGDYKDWHYQFVLAFGGDAENGRIQNAILSYNGFKKQGGPQIQFGKMKEETSLETAISGNHLTAVSRPMIANAVSPFFNWGIRANQYFADSGIRYTVGIFQAEDGGGRNGRDPGTGSSLLAYSGRLNWAPIAEKDRTLHLGVWGSYRDHGGQTLRNRARGEVRNTATRLLDSRAGGSDPTADSITQYGLEFAGVAGPLSVQAEYIERTMDSNLSGGSEADLDGYYLTASYFLTGENRRYDAAKGVFKQPKGVNNAWEIYARYSTADATFDAQGTEVEVMTLGANYHVNPNLRFMFNFLNAEVDGPGASALVGSEDGGKAFTLRTQYMF